MIVLFLEARYNIILLSPLSLLACGLRIVTFPQLQCIVGYFVYILGNKMVEHLSDMSVIRGTLSSMENRTLTISSGVPAFLAKLWKLVEDPSSDHLISWSPVSLKSCKCLMPSFLISWPWLCMACHAHNSPRARLANPLISSCCFVG